MDIILHVFAYFNHTWGYVELAGTVASLICVYLAVRQNIWTWFWGAIGVACFGPLFFNYQLYSDAGLQILFFLPMQFVGFYLWYYKGDLPGKDTMLVSYLGNKMIYVVIAILILASINGYVMFNYTDASFPYLDALTTWMSIAAQILMLRKFIESWFLWISMDVLAIGIYAAKGLYVVSGLYVIFLILATMGAIAWIKAHNEKTRA